MTVTLATHCQVECAYVITSWIYATINGKSYRALRHVDGLQIEAEDPSVEITEEIINCFRALDYKLCQR